MHIYLFYLTLDAFSPARRRLHEAGEIDIGCIRHDCRAPITRCQSTPKTFPERSMCVLLCVYLENKNYGKRNRDTPGKKLISDD